MDIGHVSQTIRHMGCSTEMQGTSHKNEHRHVKKKRNNLWTKMTGIRVDDDGNVRLDGTSGQETLNVPSNDVLQHTTQRVQVFPL